MFAIRFGTAIAFPNADDLSVVVVEEFIGTRQFRFEPEAECVVISIRLEKVMP